LSVASTKTKCEQKPIGCVNPHWTVTTSKHTTYEFVMLITVKCVIA